MFSPPQPGPTSPRYSRPQARLHKSSSLEASRHTASPINFQLERSANARTWILTACACMPAFFSCAGRAKAYTALIHRVAQGGCGQAPDALHIRSGPASVLPGPPRKQPAYFRHSRCRRSSPRVLPTTAFRRHATASSSSSDLPTAHLLHQYDETDPALYPALCEEEGITTPSNQHRSLIFLVFRRQTRTRGLPQPGRDLTAYTQDQRLVADEPSNQARLRMRVETRPSASPAGIRLRNSRPVDGSRTTRREQPVER